MYYIKNVLFNFQRCLLYYNKLICYFLWFTCIYKNEKCKAKWKKKNHNIHKCVWTQGIVHYVGKICNLCVHLCVRVHVTFVYILIVEEQKWHWQFYLTFQPELLHLSTMWYVQFVCVKILIILCSLFISLITARNLFITQFVFSVC